jgi:hypothetical protein
MFRNTAEWGKVINVGNKKGEVKRGVEKRLSEHEAHMQFTRNESLKRKGRNNTQIQTEQWY